MSSTNNSSSLPTAAEILDRFYAAERIYMAAPPTQRDFSGMAATLSKSMKLYQTPDLPYGGDYDGHEGFLRWSEAMAERFDVVDVMDPKVFEKDGESEIVVVATLRLRVKRTGSERVSPFVQVVGVDRSGGVITMIRPMYWDVRGLNEALLE